MISGTNGGDDEEIQTVAVQLVAVQHRQSHTPPAFYHLCDVSS